jgi:hypothetical protein
MRNPIQGTFTMNAQRFEKEFLRNNLPYIIKINRETNNYYFINRDYSYMGFSDVEQNADETQFTLIHLYNDGCQPWCSKTCMKNYIRKLELEIEKNNGICKSHIYIPYFGET